MTLDLSLEINHKLQAVLEDTLLKNITLKVSSVKVSSKNILKVRRENILKVSIEISFRRSVIKHTIKVSSLVYMHLAYFVK